MSSENLKAMIRRKELVLLGTDEALQEADNIAEAVERNGGLTNLEVYTLWGYTCRPTDAEIAAGTDRRDQAKILAHNPTPNLIAMRRRQELLTLGTEEALREATEIFQAVERSGGLNGAEVQALLAN